MFGLFGKKKAAPPAGEPPAAPPPAAPGWAAVDAALDALYPGQQPRHWTHGGVRRMHDARVPPENPLEGINVYDAGDHWHFVGLGLTDLYGKDSPGPASGLGHELTFRLAKREGEAQPPRWPITVLVGVARMELGGERLGPGHTLKTGPLDGQPDTRLTALLVTEDPALPARQTPHGTAAFYLLVGVDAAERERALREGIAGLIGELRARDPRLVTRP